MRSMTGAVVATLLFDRGAANAQTAPAQRDTVKLTLRDYNLDDIANWVWHRLVPAEKRQ
ncbi:MAG: hypothetical protein ACREMA_12135 [Longimicrobiales bacterium]